MDSNNWRVKRDPSDASSPPKPREQTSRPQTNGRSRWGGADRDQGGYDSPSRRSPQKGGEREGQRDGMRTPRNDRKSDKAIEEGRRLYIGNLPYEATSKDIEKLLQPVASGVEGINISVDPMTGRNPSYCFVDFVSTDLANQVMQELDSQTFLGRGLRVKPGVKSGTGGGRFHLRENRPEGNNDQKDDAFAFDRWRRLERPDEMNKAAEEGRRVHVAGLPAFEGQADANVQLRKLFEGFEVKVISKLISTPEEKRLHDVFYHYCFIDLGSPEEVSRAIKELNGTEPWGWPIKVSETSGSSKKLNERKRLFVSGLPEFPSDEATEQSIRELFEGYPIATISKLNRPRDPTDGIDGHCFCFVEMSTAEAADKVMEELDWKEVWGGKIRVKPATSRTNRAA